MWCEEGVGVEGRQGTTTFQTPAKVSGWDVCLEAQLTRGTSPDLQLFLNRKRPGGGGVGRGGQALRKGGGQTQGLQTG